MEFLSTGYAVVACRPEQHTLALLVSASSSLSHAWLRLRTNRISIPAKRAVYM